MQDRKKYTKIFLALMMAAMTVFTVSCGSSAPEENAAEDAGSAEDGEKLSGKAERKSDTDISGSFAEAHDAFTTTLVREENDDYPIPEPPEGIFDLVSYPSKVGDLAAYVSSDPGDGEKHPLIIWVVGGWGNGIDDFPWIYPEWDDDQTGSAFWQAGILTMYPSFRGGSGNPGYYEALFGEVDDIVSAYEYAASLPYVDPERIYLGGHSTGGTRALLASEYTDKFRAVFCFGAVDEIKYHNNDQFTFDTGNRDEYTMRSPIYWLENIKSPTFLIEGRDGNSECLKRMEQAYQSDNVHYFVVENADHFSVLAPATRLVAQKILEDTGDAPNISITMEELDEAMKQEPPFPVPVMTERCLEELGMTFSCPYLWDIEANEEGGLTALSRYDYDNPWDMSVIFITPYSGEEADDLQEMSRKMQEIGLTVNEARVGGHDAINALGRFEDNNGINRFQRYVIIENEGGYIDFECIALEEYAEESDSLFVDIISSIQFDD